MIVKEATPAYLSTRQVAALLGLSIKTIERMQAEGRMPKPVKIGSRNRWPLETIEQWIAMGAPPLAVLRTLGRRRFVAQK